MADVPIYERAITEVETQFNLARDFATSARGVAESLLNQLSSIADSIHQIDTNVSIDGIDYSPGAFSDEKPTVPETAMNIGSPPDRGVFDTIDLSDLTIPDVSALTVDVGHVDPAAASYGSALLTALKARLLSDVQTDIDRPDIETHKWNRARARDLLTHQDNLDRIRADWSKSGLPLPDGAMLAAIEAENVRYTNSYDDRSGQIAIEEANLAIQVRQQAIAQATQLEGILMNFLQTTQQRLFEASRATIEAKVQAYNVEAAKYRILADIYASVSNVRIAEAKSKVDIYMAEVTAFKAEVEAEAARLDAVVKAYNGEVEAYKADVDAYEAVSAVEAQIMKTQADLAVSRAQLYLKNAEIEIAQYQGQINMQIETVKAMGQIVAQEVAGALSSIQASAGMTRHDDASVSYNYSGEI